MAREVNVFFTRPSPTGINVQVPQYTMDVTFNWIDNSGAPHTGTRTITFPNVLAQIPAERLIDLMQDIIMERARTALVVDA